MLILGIDPGSKAVGLALWDSKKEKILYKREQTPESVLSGIYDVDSKYSVCRLPGGDMLDPKRIVLAIEQIRGYGLTSGNETFDTCEYIGAYRIAAQHSGFKKVYRIPRKSITSFLCGTSRAGDTEIRNYLIDRIGPKGTQKFPGPTFGFNQHTWPALAAAICLGEVKREAAHARRLKSARKK